MSRIRRCRRVPVLLLRLLPGLESSNLLAQLDQAGGVLLSQLGADFVESHQRVGSVDIILSLWSLISKQHLHEFCRRISLLTSDSFRGVPGIDPCAELVRESGGVPRSRRLYLSNVAGEAVREMMEEADPTRW